MKNNSRYKASGAESEYQTGSDELVLRNLLQITDPVVMEEIETNALADLIRNF